MRLLSGLGISHFSISVSDLKGLADDLASKGVEFAGPVFVTGSEPGDLLEVTILRFEPAAWAGANELGRAE